MDFMEAKIARYAVDTILKRAATISVWEGEDWALVKSADAEEIMRSLGSTDSDQIHGLDANGKSTGCVVLIWGNGEDLISDSSESYADIDFFGE